MSLLVLSAKDVDTIVSAYQPEDLQLLMAQLFSQFSHRGIEESCQPRPSISMPPRLGFPMLNHTALFMPARIGPATNSNADVASSVHGNTALKVVCVPNKSDARGLPATTVVLDESTGNVKAIVNARKLTALRNAAGATLYKLKKNLNIGLRVIGRIAFIHKHSCHPFPKVHHSFWSRTTG
jgi:ornithine cyclodeaminase/alanine dehydrogenase-like protein (mu-crystallin family)